MTHSERKRGGKGCCGERHSLSDSAAALVLFSDNRARRDSRAVYLAVIPRTRRRSAGRSGPLSSSCMMGISDAGLCPSWDREQYEQLKNGIIIASVGRAY